LLLSSYPKPLSPKSTFLLFWLFLQKKFTHIHPWRKESKKWTLELETLALSLHASVPVSSVEVSGLKTITLLWNSFVKKCVFSRPTTCTWCLLNIIFHLGSKVFQCIHEKSSKIVQSCVPVDVLRVLRTSKISSVWVKADSDTFDFETPF
jgi:hypothetical protein